MSDLPTPAAARLARPRWLDARLLTGLLLVLLSVVVGAKVFAEADDRVRVWSVTRDLGADTVLAEDDLAVRSVGLDEAAGRYVSAAEQLDGLVLTRPVGKDELLPLAALRESGATARRRVVIEVDRFAAAGLDKGQVVDVYAVPETKSGEPTAEPELVLAEVTVAEDVSSGAGALTGGGSKAGVTLFVGAADVARVIRAVAHGTVYLAQVPAGGGPGGQERAAGGP